MEPGDPDLISGDISLILISSIQLPPGAPDLSLFGIPVLAGRLVFAVSWQPARSLGEHAGWERSPGGGAGSLWRDWGGDKSWRLPSAQRPQPKAKLGDKPLLRHRKRLREAVNDWRPWSPSPTEGSTVAWRRPGCCELAMAFGLLRKDFFFQEGKPPPALYHPEPK